MIRHVVSKGVFISSFLCLISAYSAFALNVSKCELVGAYVGNCSKVEKIIPLAKKGINAIVVDVKNDEGRLLLDLDKDGEEISKFVKKLKENNFYTIARIVAFKDKMKVKQNQSWAICNPDGSLYVDKEKMSWLNPYNREVQKYLIKLAKKAIKAGFDEVQYDYIRFSVYKSLNETDIAENFIIKSKVEIINDFLKKATKTVHKHGGIISADVFGCIIPYLFSGWEDNAAVLGQDYEKIAAIVDYICPMVYPSHFPLKFSPMREIVLQNGKTKKMHFNAPDLHPYEIIRESLLASHKSSVDRNKVRPWLQCFSASWLKGNNWKRYNNADIQKQIDATTDQDISQCCIWNPGANYSILN